MKVQAIEVTNKLVNDFYGPVVKVEYKVAKFFSCRRELIQGRRTKEWYFAADRTAVPSALAIAVTTEYDKLLEARRHV